MKNLFLVLFAFVALGFSGCTTVDPEVFIPATDPLRPSDGGLDLKFADPEMERTSTTTGAVSDEVTATLIIKKSATGGKPRKLVIYVSDKEDEQGTLFIDNIKLKNIDEQTQTVSYSLPSNTSATKYFHFEVINNSEKWTRRTLKVNLVAQGQLSIHNDITLGAQSSALGSRLTSTTGIVYTVCDLDSNMKHVDITYAVSKDGTSAPQFLSNPQRKVQDYATSGVANSCFNPVTGAQDVTPFTGGGTSTYFIATELTVTDFSNATDQTINPININSTNPEFVKIATGKVYAFLNSKGKKGLIYVKTINPGSTGFNGDVKIDVKVQK